MQESSGHRELDDVARRAIEASSGRVKRPKILVIQDVRFQYGLR